MTNLPTILVAAEARLGNCLPKRLRNFYRAWGRRPDLTEGDDPFLSPQELLVREDTLLFWMENQAIYYGGVPCRALVEADPEVVLTAPGPSGWEVEAGLEWKPSQTSLSGFLDAMTYLRAFDGAAIHGACTEVDAPPLSAEQVAWLEAHWQKASVSPMTFRLMPDDPVEEPYPTLYVREGQAFSSLSWHRLITNKASSIDEIGQQLGIMWSGRW